MVDFDQRRYRILKRYYERSPRRGLRIGGLLQGPFGFNPRDCEDLLKISSFAAGTRARVRIIADYAAHIDATLAAEQGVRNAEFANLRAATDDEASSLPERDDMFSADGAIHRIVWNSHAVALISLLEDRLREAWRGLVRSGAVHSAFDRRLSFLVSHLEQQVPGVNEPSDSLTLDVEALIRIRNQIVHADSDGEGLGERARDILAMNQALNTSGEDEVQCNAAFAAFAQSRVTEYLERLLRLLPEEAQTWPTF